MSKCRAWEISRDCKEHHNPEANVRIPLLVREWSLVKPQNERRHEDYEKAIEPKRLHNVAVEKTIQRTLTATPRTLQSRHPIEDASRKQAVLLRIEKE
jgi:hypothetical protein